MLKADVMETLLYGCATWTLGKEHFAECTIFVLQIIVFQRRHRTERLMSYAKALKKAQRESVETTISKRQGPQEGTTRESRRPLASGVSCLRGPYCGRTMSD